MRNSHKRIQQLRKKALGTYAISKICQVAPITVGRWIAEGKLPYFTTGGGHRRVWEEDLVKFLKAHNYPVPKNLKSSLHPTILIVDDLAVTRRFIRRALEKTLPLAQIDEAADGYEAGEKISTGIPSVVILDITLPGLNGIKVCERIRLNKALKSVKILAITVNTSEEMKEKVLKAGADAFICKPFQAEALIKTVGKLLGHS